MGRLVMNMTYEEAMRTFQQVCERLREAEKAGEGTLLDSIEVGVLAYAIRDMSSKILAFNGIEVIYPEQQ